MLRFNVIFQVTLKGPLNGCVPSYFCLANCFFDSESEVEPLNVIGIHSTAALYVSPSQHCHFVMLAVPISYVVVSFNVTVVLLF